VDEDETRKKTLNFLHIFQLALLAAAEIQSHLLDDLPASPSDAREDRNTSRIHIRKGPPIRPAISRITATMVNIDGTVQFWDAATGANEQTLKTSSYLSQLCATFRGESIS
jgi:hypothetical protein